jgi:thiol-disulfide isomerase/thioredoxin
LKPLVLVTLAACAAAPPVPASSLPRVQVLGPDARTPTDLAVLANGRPLVVDVFATWCEACRQGLPGMNELARAHRGGDVVVVGLDVGEERAAVERFVARAGVDYPVYYDPELRFEDSLGLTELPLILVIDGSGRIVHRSARLDDATRAAISEASR